MLSSSQVGNVFVLMGVESVVVVGVSSCVGVGLVQPVKDNDPTVNNVTRSKVFFITKISALYGKSRITLSVIVDQMFVSNGTVAGQK